MTISHDEFRRILQLAFPATASSAGDNDTEFRFEGDRVRVRLSPQGSCWSSMIWRRLISSDLLIVLIVRFNEAAAEWPAQTTGSMKESVGSENHSWSAYLTS